MKADMDDIFNQIMEYEKKIAETPLMTIKEWGEVYGVVVHDPDGFDRSDPYLFRRLFTAEEFENGAIRSTCQFRRDGLFFQKFLAPKWESPTNE